LDTTFEVIEQAVYGGEDVGSLLTSDMPMITLPSFVVVPNPLFAGGTVEQAVLEAMNAWLYGLRNLPMTTSTMDPSSRTSLDRASSEAFVYCMIAIHRSAVQ
jgi:hypothetical protein